MLNNIKATYHPASRTPTQEQARNSYNKCYLFLHRLRAPPVPHLFCPSVCQAFAVCHKMWPYRRDFDAANLSKKFKCKNEPCRTIFRG